MDNETFIGSIIHHIEAHIQEKIQYKVLEKSIGMSYRYIRQIFPKYSHLSLSRYINSRKIANAAFEIVNTEKDITDIAMNYGFDVYDTFTRVFKRHTGLTPNEFRKENLPVNIGLIGVGMYAPVISKDVTLMSDEIMTKPSGNGSILFGIPKLEYSSGKCVPFAACLESALQYIGHSYKHNYAYIMAACGAAFRLRWNSTKWDTGNVDLRNINFEKPYEPFIRSFKAVGINYSMLSRENSTKEDFKNKIIVSLDKGVPVIGLGIIGPPEACIITGYDNKGETLFGWSYFQDNPEFTKDVAFLENGYFSTNAWWDNLSSTHLFILGTSGKPEHSVQDIIEYAYSLLTMSSTGMYSAGLNAYDSWAKSLQNDDFFSGGSITPIILESIFCQGDAETMTGEGRYWASEFFKEVADTNEKASSLCHDTANLFKKISNCGQKMTELRGGVILNEQTISKFCDPETRKSLAKIICQTKEYEANAIQNIGSILKQL